MNKMRRLGFMIAAVIGFAVAVPGTTASAADGQQQAKAPCGFFRDFDDQGQLAAYYQHCTNERWAVEITVLWIDGAELPRCVQPNHTPWLGPSRWIINAWWNGKIC